MPTDLPELALGLYESLLDGQGLGPVLSRVAREVGASSHAVHRITYRNGQPVGSVASGEGGAAGAPLEEYARYWVRHDPWAQACAAMAPGVHDIAAAVPPAALRASRIWNEWGRPNDAAFHALGVPLLREGESVAGVFFHRRETEPAFAETERAKLEALFAHLRRAFAAEAQLAEARLLPGTAGLAALDALPDGVALLDEARRLVFANASLQRMAAMADGFRLGAEGPEADAPAARAALARAVTAALAAAAGRLGLLPTAGTLALPRPSGRAPWLVRAVPLRRAEGLGLGPAFSGAMLLVGDAERRARPEPVLLARLFGLTPAQAALAAALASGDTLEAHAKRRGISPETARSHLAEVRRRTGCRRRSELALLLARLPG